jgi:hypothetical protein
LPLPFNHNPHRPASRFRAAGSVSCIGFRVRLFCRTLQPAPARPCDACIWTEVIQNKLLKEVARQKSDCQSAFWRKPRTLGHNKDRWHFSPVRFAGGTSEIAAFLRDWNSDARVFSGLQTGWRRGGPLPLFLHHSLSRNARGKERRCHAVRRRKLLDVWGDHGLRHRVGLLFQKLPTK